MEFTVLSSVIKELSSVLVGARVDRVYQGADAGLYLLLLSGGRKYVLFLSPDRTLPRIHLVSVKPEAGKSPGNFTLYLRSHLTNARISYIGLMNRDRIVEIRFVHSDNEYCLIFELIGRAANLILTDPMMKISAVYYPVPLSAQKARALLPGLAYVLPENTLSNKARDSRLTADQSTMGSPSTAAEQYYVRLLEQQRTMSLRNELDGLLRKTLSRNERLVNALTKELVSVERAEVFKQLGELLLANLHAVRTGAEQADLIGFDGSKVTVPLDPRISSARNAEVYFKKYKKAKAGRSIIETRLQQAKDGVHYITRLLPVLARTSDHRELMNIRSELAERGYVVSGRGNSRTEPASLPFKKILFNGWDILVGKNAAGNDYISTKLARPDDLWLHAEGLPGSHVLVRNPGKRDVPSGVLLKAAAVAAFYSKGRGSGTVPVTYTRAGFVKKPKGAKPGLVMISERKSIMVKPESE